MGASYMYHLIDSSINELTNKMGSEKMSSIDNQLLKAKTKRDSLQNAFANFQIQNKAYDVRSQLEMSIEVYGRMREREINQELLYQKNKQLYSDKHPSVQNIAFELSSIRNRLESFLSNDSATVIGGLNRFSVLLNRYSNFRSEIEVQNKVVLLLSQQYESAKLKAEMQRAQLRLVDPSIKPDYKARPSRAKLSILLFSGYLIILLTLLTVRYLYVTILSKEAWFNDFKKALFQ
jgi:capsule polysaccharide export protein KpsE/RkpR